MAQEKPNPLGEWLNLARRNAPIAREHFNEWLGAVREEPRLLWETSAVRYSTYGLGGLLIAWLAIYLLGLFVPPPPPGARAQATTADFHVICSRPECGHHFQIHRPFGFHNFPVECPACKQTTGVKALLCTSPTCVNRWVVPVEKEGRPFCSRCAAPL